MHGCLGSPARKNPHPQFHSACRQLGYGMCRAQGGLSWLDTGLGCPRLHPSLGAFVKYVGKCKYETSFHHGENNKSIDPSGNWKTVGFLTFSVPSPTPYLYTASRKCWDWKEKLAGCHSLVFNPGGTLESLGSLKKILLGPASRGWIQLVWGTDWILVLK